MKIKLTKAADEFAGKLQTKYNEIYEVVKTELGSKDDPLPAAAKFTADGNTLIVGVCIKPPKEEVDKYNLANLPADLNELK